jgi:hypothetical protein
METKKLHIRGYVLATSDCSGTIEEDVAYTESENLAKEWKSKSSFNSARGIDKEYVFHFINSMSELTELNLAKKREKALGKLTFQEKVLLGLV